MSPLAVLAAFVMVVSGLGVAQLSQKAVTPAHAASTQGTFSPGGWRTTHSGSQTINLNTGGTSTPVPFAPIDRNHLYGSTNTTTGPVWYYSEPIASNTQTLIGRGVSASSLSPDWLSTMAVDADPYGTRGTTAAYLWPWNSPAVSTAENGGTPPPANTSFIVRWNEGETNGSWTLVPTPNYFGDQGGYQYWSAGEVIQRTGEVFMGGGECTGINTSYNMMIFDPVTFKYNFSGLIKPATSADNIFGNLAQPCGAVNGYVASDFALDANGNAYLTVFSNQAAPTFGLNAAARNWLVRVTPGTNGADWTYELVTPLQAAPGNGGGAANYANGSLSYGQAFFNGMLYSLQTGAYLVMVNPMSGLVYNLPLGGSSSPGNGPLNGNPFDLASGQTAQVLDGTVYNDANANGKIESSETGAPNVTVGLYLKNSSGNYVLEGVRQTNESGHYSFLLGGDGDYIVRVAQPQINGVNAVQTWASAGTSSVGAASSATITAKCASGDITTAAGGACNGAKPMPAADPPVPTDLAALGTNTATQPGAMAIYSMISIKGDQVVGTANFGVTALGSFGDSSVGPASVAANAPVHINGVDANRLYLGSENGQKYNAPATNNTAHNATDDGVYIQSYSGNIPLQGTMLAGTKTYNLQSKVSGTDAGLSSVNVSGWTTAPGGTTWNTTATWQPTISAGLASGTYQVVSSGTALPTAQTVQMRAQVSETPTTLPTNASQQYQGRVNQTDPAWATPGEIEDYTFQAADAVYRPAAITTAGNATFLVDGASIAANPSYVTYGPAKAAASGVAKTITIDSQSTNWMVSGVQVKNTQDGTVVSTPTVTPTGPTTSTFTFTPQLGDDLTLEVTFTKAPDITKSTLTMSPLLTATDPESATAPVGSPITATATVQASDGTPLPGVRVDFAKTSADISLSATYCITGDGKNGTVAGQCTVEVNSNKAGTYPHEISATVMIGATATPLAGSPKTVTFAPQKGDPGHSTLTVTPTGNVTVSPTSGFTATVTVHDTLGNLVPGDVVKFTVTRLDGTPVDTTKTKLSAPECTTSNVSGAAYGTCQVALTSTEAGSFKIHATLPSLDTGADTDVLQSPATVNFTALPDPDPAQSSLTVTPAGPLTVGGTAAPNLYTATVTVKDVYGNPIPGATVDWTVTKEDGSAVAAGTALSATTCKTIAVAGPNFGTCVVELTSQNAGSFKISAKVTPASGTAADVQGSPKTVSFTAIPDPDPVKSELVVTPASPLPVGSTYTATTTVRDKYNNPIPSQTVTYSVMQVVNGVEQAAPAGVTLTPATCQTSAVAGAAFGTCQATLTSTVAGTFAIHAKVTPVGGTLTDVTNSPKQVVFEVGPDAWPTHSTLDVTPTTSLPVGTAAANTFTAKTTARDNHDNLVPGVTVQYTVTKADGSAVDPAKTKLSASTCTTSAVSGAAYGTCFVTLTSTESGQFVISAKVPDPDNGNVPTNIINSPKTVTYDAGQPCSTNSDLSVDMRSAVVVTGTITATVNVRDCYNNPVADGASVNLALTGSAKFGGGSGAATATLLTIGGKVTATFSDATAEKVQVSATVYDSATSAIKPVTNSPIEVEFKSNGIVDPAKSTFTVAPSAGSANPPHVGDPATGPAESWTATLTARDATGNLVTTLTAGDVVFLPTFDGLATNLVKVSAIDTSQAANGIYTATLTSTKAWVTFPVTAKAQGQTIIYPTGDPNAGQPVVRNITFQAQDTPDVTTHTTLAVAPSSVQVGGTSTATVTMRDQYNNLVNNPSVVVRFTVTGSATITPATQQCSASATITDPTDPKFGTCSVTVTDTKAETVDVAATIGGTAVSNSPQQVTFTNTPVSEEQSLFTVAPTTTSPVIAGQMTWTATVTAKDTMGNLLPNLDPSVITFSPDAGVTVGTVTNAGGGLYKATLSAPKAGTYNVTAAVAGKTIVDGTSSATPKPVVTRQVTFVNGPAAPGHTSLSVDHQTVNVSQPVTATVIAKDANDNLVGNQVVKFYTNSPTATFDGTTSTTGQCTTGPDGTCKVTVTTPTAGPVVLHATVPDTTLTPPADKDVLNSPITLQFDSTEPNGEKSTFTVAITTGSLNPPMADGTQSWTATVTLKDDNGNALPGKDPALIKLTITPAVTPPVSVTGFTDVGGGVYTAKITSLKSGTFNATAAYDTTTIVDPASTTTPKAPVVRQVAFQAGQPDPLHSDLAVSTTTPSTGPATSTGTLATVTVKDANDNLVGGQAVQIAATGSSVMTPNTCTTNNTAGDAAFGTCQFKVTDTVAEQVTISAKLNGADVKNSPTSVTFKPGNIDPAMSFVDAQPPTQKVGANVVVTVTLRDSLGNGLTGYTAGQFTVTGTSPGKTNLVMASWTEMGNGKYTYNTTSYETGTFTFDATVAGVHLTGTQGNTQVRFDPGDPCLTTAQCAKPSTFKVTLNDQLANGTAQDEITAQAYDIYGNVIPNAAVQITDTTTTPALVGQLQPRVANATTDANGQAVLKFRTNVAGQYSAVGTINGGQPATGNITDIRFGNAAAGRSVLTIVESGPYTVGNTYHAKVQVFDGTGNAVPNTAVTFTSNSTDMTFTGDTTGKTTTCTTGTDGSCQVTFTTTVAASYQISSTIPVNGTATPSQNSPATVVFGPGQVCMKNQTDCPGGSEVVVTRNGALSDNNATNQATAYARDRYGNGVNGVTVTTAAITAGLTVVSGNNSQTATGVDPVDGKTKAGIAQLTYSSGTPGDKQASATINGQPATGSPFTMTFQQTPVSPTNSTLDVQPAGPLPAGTDAGSTYTATATARDAQNNIVQGAVVSFSVQTGATLSQTSCTTGSSGTCAVSVYSTKAGTFTLGATVLDAGGVPRAITGSPKNLTWTAGPMCTGPAPCKTRVEVTFTGAQPDGVQRNSVTVYAFDAYDNPITGATVATTTDGNMTAQDAATPPTPISPIGADGTSTIWYTSTVPGDHVAHVTVNGTEVRNSPVTLGFGVPLDPAKSSFDISPAGPLTVGETSTSTYTITMHARGSNGVAVIGAVVQFNATPAGVTWVGGKQSCTTGTDGTCQVQVYSTKSGPFDFTAMSATSPIGSAQSRTWKADAACIPTGPNDPNCKTNVQVTLDYQTANGTDTDIATVTAYDRYGNPVPGALVSSLASNPGQLTVGAAQTTDDNGKASIQYRSTVAGAHQAQVLLNSNPLATVTLNFVPGAIDPTKSMLTATPSTQHAGSPVTVQVTLRDSFNNLLPGYTSNQFTVSATSAGLPTITVDSFGETSPGVYTGTTTSKALGTFTFSGTVSGVNLVQHPTVTFDAGPICLSKDECDKPSYFEVTLNNQVANGTAQDEVTAHAFDIYGNPIAGAAVKVTDATTTTGLTGYLTPNTANATTGPDGTAVVKFSTTKMGTYSAEGTINGLRPNPSGGITNLTFISDKDPSPQQSNLTVAPVTQEAGAPITASAVIRDANRNPIEGIVVSFSSDSANVTFKGTTATTATCTTDANGACNVPLTSTVAGAYKITATVPVQGSPQQITGSPASVTFTPTTLCMKNDTDCLGGSEVKMTSDGALSDGTATNQATAFARDRYGNGINGVTVTTTAITADLQVRSGASGQTATVNINGVATPGVAQMTYASTVPGAKQASATIDGQTPPGSPLNMSFVQTAVDPAKSTLEVSPAGPLPAGTGAASAYTATATARDGQNNVVPGAVVTFAVTPATGAKLSQPSCQTGASGTCQVTVTSTSVGKVQLTATVPNASGTPTAITGSPKTLEWVVGQLCTSGADCKTRVEVTTDGQSNDGVQRDIATVYAFDASGNPIPGLTVASIARDPSVLNVQTDIQPTNAQGVTTIGYTSLVATSGPPGHLADVTVGGQAIPGSPVGLQFGKPIGSTSTFTVTPSGPLTVGDQAANTYTLTASARDTDNHALPGAVVTFSVTPAGPVWAGGQPSCTTGADGTCQVKLYSTKSGSYAVSAISGTTPIGSAQTVRWNADAVCFDANCKTNAKVTTNFMLADGTARDVVTVWAYDRFDNPVGGAFVSSVADSAVTVQQGIDVTALPDGASTIWYTSKVAGDHQVAVSVEGHALPTLTINFKPGVPSAEKSVLSVDTATQKVGGNVVATATVKDANDNPIPDMTVTFGKNHSASFKDAASTCKTGADGKCSVTLSDAVAEQVVLTATVPIAGTDTQLKNSPLTVTFTNDTPAPIITSPKDGALTNAKPLPISGTGTDGQQVTVSDQNGKPVCSAPVTNGTWSCTAALDDGNYTLTAVQKDTNGNLSPASQPVQVKVDTTPPPVPVISTPAAGPTNNPNPKISGTGGEAGTTITVTDGPTGPMLCEATVQPDGSWSCTVPPAKALLDGTHTLTAVASDAAGNKSGPGTKTIDVDTIPPAAPVVLTPVANVPINNPKPEISGTGENGAKVTVTDGPGGPVVCGPVTVVGGAWSCTPTTPLGDGKHTLSTTQTDPAGNTSPATLTPFTVDTSKPKPPVVNHPTPGQETNDTTPTVDGTADPGTTVTVTDENGNKLCQAVADTTGAWSCTPTTPLDPGEHTITVIATNPAGTDSDPTKRTFTVDTTPPAAPVVTSPKPGDVTNDPTPTVTGTGENGATVTVKDEAGNALCTAKVANGSWSCTPPDNKKLDDGTHTLTVTQTDPAGNTSPATTVPFKVDTTAPPAPKIETANGTQIAGTAEKGSTVTVTVPGVATPITVPADPDTGAWSVPTPAGAKDGDVTATATDPAGNVSPKATAPLDVTKPSLTVDTANATKVAGTSDDPTAKVVVTWPDGTKSAPVQVNSDGTYSVPTPPGMPSGPITVTATDPAGNTTTKTAQLNTDKPGAPVITTANAAKVAGTAAPGKPLVPGSTATVTWPDGSKSAPITIDAQGKWSIPTPPGMPSGTIKAVVTDPYGNVSPEGTAYLDTRPPVPPVVTKPADGEQTNTTTPEIAGTAEPNTDVTVTDEKGNELCTAKADAVTGAWKCTVPPDKKLGEGDHTISVVATDPAGNKSDPTTKTFTVDTTPPSKPVVDTPKPNQPINTTTPVISGTADKDAKVTVTVPGPDGKTPVVVPGCENLTPDSVTGKWSCTPKTALPEGNNTITVVATDGAGNKSEPVVVPFTVDTQAPDAPKVDHPANGSATKDPQPKFDGTAEKGSTVTVTKPDVFGTQVPVPGCIDVKADETTGAWSCTPASPIGDDYITFQVTAKDPAGNVSLPTKVQVQIDTRAPEAANLDPSNGNQISGDAHEAGLTVAVKDGAGNVIPGCENLVSGALGKFSCTPRTPLADGATVTVVTTDPAGNTSAPATVTVGAAWVKATYAAVYRGELQGSFGDRWVPGETITVRVDPGLDLGTVTARADRSAYAPNFVIPSNFALGTHTITWTGSVSGVHTATFKVIANPNVNTNGGGGGIKVGTGGSVDTGSPLGLLAGLSLVSLAFAVATVYRRRNQTKA